MTAKEMIIATVLKQGYYIDHTPAERQLPAQAGRDTFFACDSSGIHVLLSSPRGPEYLHEDFTVVIEVIYG